MYVLSSVCFVVVVSTRVGDITFASTPIMLCDFLTRVIFKRHQELCTNFQLDRVKSKSSISVVMGVLSPQQWHFKPFRMCRGHTPRNPQPPMDSGVRLRRPCTCWSDPTPEISTLSIYLYVYTYIESERERVIERGRERETETDTEKDRQITLYVYIYIHIYVNVWMYVCMHVCMYVCIHL